MGVKKTAKKKKNDLEDSVENIFGEDMIVEE